MSKVDEIDICVQKETPFPGREVYRITKGYTVNQIINQNCENVEYIMKYTKIRTGRAIILFRWYNGRFYPLNPMGGDGPTPGR